MSSDYKNFTENNKIIKEETKKTVLISIAMLISIVIYALISYFIGSKNGIKFIEIDKKTIKLIFDVLNVLAITMVISVLTIRRTIYYSTKFIKDDFNIKQILSKWRTLDIILLSIGESIALLGLTITILGMPFARTFHFFITSALVILIIMPINWKVRDKLRNLNFQRDMHISF
ncbi:MAG: hypothetical protein ABFR75_01675 [Acidobacteriota bacterium]